jgi:hypothetical protein
VLSESVDVGIKRQTCLEPQVLRREYQRMVSSIEQNFFCVRSQYSKVERASGKSKADLRGRGRSASGSWKYMFWYFVSRVFWVRYPEVDS